MYEVVARPESGITGYNKRESHLASLVSSVHCRSICEEVLDPRTMNKRRSEPATRVLSPPISKGRTEKYEIRRRQSPAASTTMPTSSSTQRVATATTTQKLMTMPMPTSSSAAVGTKPIPTSSLPECAAPATTHQEKENLQNTSNTKRINQAVRRAVAKERKRIKKEEFHKRKASARYAARTPPAPIPPAYIPPIYTSPHTQSFYPSIYVPPITYAPPAYAQPLPSYAQPLPSYAQPLPAYAGPNFMTPAYNAPHHIYFRPHF